MQQRLFYESWQDAVNAAVTNSGKTVKAVASALWPHMKIDSAYARFKNALNNSKDEKLTFDEIIFVCNHIGQFDPLYFMAQECSHTIPEPRAPEDEKAALMREFITTGAALKKIADRINHIEDKTLRAV